MNWLLKRDLPSVKGNIKNISKNIFEIIHKYATGQNCTGDNAELVMSSFKVNIFLFIFIVINVCLCDHHILC